MADTPDVNPSQAELDRGFRAWVATNEYLLECEFLDFDVVGMPDDPYTEEGLRIAEAEALRRFPDLASAMAPETKTCSSSSSASSARPWCDAGAAKCD